MAFTKSKFRFSKFTSCKDSFRDLRVPSALGHSLSIAASAKWLAVPYGDGQSKGNVQVLPSAFKDYEATSSPPLIGAHSELTDLAFSPFNDSLLATSGTDGVVKLWKVPKDGLTESTSASYASAQGLDSIHSIKFHRSAGNVLGVAHKTGMATVDLNKGAVVHSFELSGYGNDVTSVDFSYDGRVIYGVSKKKHLHLFDPRTAAGDVLGGSAKLDSRPQRAFLLSKEGHIMVLAADSVRKPIMHIFDSRMFDASAPVKTHRPGFSHGHVLADVDLDTQLLYMCMRGSTTLGIYDVSKLTDLEVCDTSPSKPIQGFALVPKAGCDLYESEITRVCKLYNDSVQPAPVRVPRKAAGFHDELFPPTIAGDAALSAQDWFDGKDAEPSLVPVNKLTNTWMAPGQRPKASTSATSTETKTSTSSAPKEDTSASTASSAKDTTSAPTPAVVEEKKQIYVPTNTRRRIDSLMKKSIFQHTRPNWPRSRSLTAFDVKPDVRNSVSCAKTLMVNSKYWAVPWASIGGSAVCVIPHDRVGRISQPALVRGHSAQVSAFSLSQLKPNWLATGGTSANIHLFDLPDGGPKEEISKPTASFKGSGKVSIVDFHPSLENVLVTASTGFDSTALRHWDLETSKELFNFQGFESPIVDVAFDLNCKNTYTTAKDNKVRVLDVRTNKVVQEWTPPESRRDCRVLSLGDNRVLTVGFAKGSERSISLWDLSNTSKALDTLGFDNSNALMMPVFDSDTDLLYLASVGSSVLRLFQVSHEKKIEFIDGFQLDGDAIGFGLKPKSMVDVKAVEIANGFVLEKDKTYSISFSVPRKRKEFFQDDVYPPTRALQPVMSTAEFVDGEVKDPPYINLQPAGLTPLSEAPAEKMTERQLRYKKQQEEMKKEVPKGILGTAEETTQHFQKMAESGAGLRNRWDADVESGDEIDDDEWSD